MALHLTPPEDVITLPAAVGLATLTLPGALAWLAAYLLTGGLVVLLQAQPGPSLWYPPVAFGVLLFCLYGRRAWLVVFLGDLVVSLAQYASLPAGLVVAANTLLEAALAAALLARARVNLRIPTVGDLARLFILGAALPALVGATHGGLWLLALGLVTPGSALGTWLTWWLGDAVTIMCLLPALLLWAVPPRKARDIRPLRSREGVALILLAIVFSLLAFSWGEDGHERMGHSLQYLYLLPIIWAAIRFGVRATATTLALIGSLAVAITFASSSPAGLSTPLDTHLVLDIQLFMLTLTLGGTTLALTVEGERRASAASQRDAAALRASEARLRQVLQEMPVLLNAFDAAGTCIVWNGEAERVSGYSAAEIVGNPRAWELLYPDVGYRTALQEAWARRGDDYRGWEWSLTHRDGSPRVISWSNIAARAPIAGWASWGIGVDVTEQRRAEAALAEREELFRQLAETVREVFWIRDLARDRIIYVNPAYATIWGRPCQELYEQPESFLAAIHPDDRQRVVEAKAHQEGEAFFSETYRIVRPDGSLRWVWARTFPVTAADGTVYRLVGLAEDVTERVQIDEALRATRELLSTVIDHAPANIFVIDTAGRFQLVNRAWETFFGRSRDQTIGASVPEVLAEPTATQFVTTNQQVLTSGEPLSYDRQIQGADGQSRIFQVIKFPIRAAAGSIAGVGGVFFDVTERTRAEEALARRNRELALLNRVIAASAASVAPEAILATICRELALAFESPRALAALRPLYGTGAQLVAAFPEGAPAPPPTSLDMLLAPVRASRTPAVSATPDGHQLVLPVPLGDEVVGAVCLLAPAGPWDDADIALAASVILHAAGALARARLTEAHQLLSVAQEQAGESTVITDASGAILAVNPAFERMSGYTQQEVLGKNPRILKSGVQDAGFYRNLWKTLTRGEVWRGRLVNRRKDGVHYTEDATIAPIRGRDGRITHYVAVKRNVTRELELEAQFRQSQKMEAVGRLAGGIAHDFNNLLSVINGYSEFLLEAHPDPGDPARRDVEAIRQAGERAAGLTRQLLAFSRRQSLQPQVLDLNEVLGELEQLLRRLIGEDITVVLRRAPELWPVAVDRGQLEQVVMNLAVNARDAMPAGGTLTFTTHNLPRGAEPERSEDGVRFEVADTGVGMRPETLEHLFEPFYTTKAPGQGTGLGLATVHGIVTQSGGTIAVQSAPGAGTRFIIDLPRHHGGAEWAPETPEREQPRSEAATILLVEDEPEIRALATRALRAEGHVVLAAADAAEALQQHQRTAPIALLLSDIGLPDMSGVALAAELRRRQPELAVLLVSGYPDRTLAGEPAQAAVLLKPFTPAMLAQAVREALARAAEQPEDAPQLDPPAAPMPSAAPAVLAAAEPPETPSETAGQSCGETIASLRATNAALHWHLMAQTESLRASEALFQALFSTAAIGIALVDLDGCVIMANEADARLLGYSLEELRGMHFSQFTHPDDLDLDTELFAELLAGTRPSYTIDKRYIRKDGRTVWGHLAVSLMRDRAGSAHSAIITCEDITERLVMEAALRESEQRWQFAVEAANDGLWDWDYPSGAVYFSDQWQTMLGYTPGEVPGHVSTWERLVHPDDLARVMATLQAHLDGSSPSYTCEHRLRHKAGGWVWVLDRGKVIARDEAGQPLRVVGTHTNITERRAAVEALRASEARFRTLVERAPIAIVLVQRGIVRQANQACANLLGLASPRDMEGLPAVRWIAPEARAAMLERFQSLGTGTPPTLDYTTVALRADGRRLAISVSAVVLDLADGLVSVAFITT